MPTSKLASCPRVTGLFGSKVRSSLPLTNPMATSRLVGYSCTEPSSSLKASSASRGRTNAEASSIRTSIDASWAPAHDGLGLVTIVTGAGHHRLVGQAGDGPLVDVVGGHVAEAPTR